jgi:hypothetical protein
MPWRTGILNTGDNLPATAKVHRNSIFSLNRRLLGRNRTAPYN